VRPIRRRAVVVAALVLVAMPAKAVATFPKLLSARVLLPDDTEAGVASGFGNTGPDYWTTYAFARRGLFRSVETGLRAGLLSAEREADDARGWLGGADAKVQVLRESIDIPIDFAVDAGFTATRLEGRTWSDLAFAALFSSRADWDWLRRRVPATLTATVGVELVYLGGRARPRADDSAAYGLVNLEVRLRSGLAVVPELKAGSDMVYGVGVSYRF
jgi:hypothetical protein